jgi:hypothetical protein
MRHDHEWPKRRFPGNLFGRRVDIVWRVPRINKRMIKIFEVLTVLLLLSSCSPLTKEQYISDYRQFINEVKENKDTYSEEQWQKKDILFGKYSNTLFPKFESALTPEDKIILTKYHIEYDVYRYKNEAGKTLLDHFNSYIEIGNDTRTATNTLLIEQKNALKRQIENYIDTEMNDDANFLIEQGQKVKNTLSRVLDELTTETEEN